MTSPDVLRWGTCWIAPWFGVFFATGPALAQNITWERCDEYLDTGQVSRLLDFDRNVRAVASQWTYALRVTCEPATQRITIIASTQTPMRARVQRSVRENQIGYGRPQLVALTIGEVLQ